MDELTITIGALNSATGTVPVTFSQGEIVHKRSVNAVIKSNGTHDRAGTVARVDKVAWGVAAKIALGVISTQSPSSAEPSAQA